MSVDDTLNYVAAALDGEFRVHALLGPSGAKKWASCTAAPQAEIGLPDTTHERTRYGTTGHAVLDECLSGGKSAAAYLGRQMLFMREPGDKRVEVWADQFYPAVAELEHTVSVDAEMVEKVETVALYVRDLVAAFNGELFTEQRLSIEHITGERGACGTTDVGILARAKRTAIILDLKLGFVKVYAQDSTVIDGIIHRKPNLQLAMYADAFLQKYDPLGFDIDTVTLIVAQPFVHPPFNEASFTRAELAETIAWLSERAEKTRTAPEFVPSYEACMWCKAKPTCAARTRVVLTAAATGFTDTEMVEALPPLGEIHELIPLIRDWCNDQELLVMAELKAGRPVVGKKGSYKLVDGAQGDRKWDDPAVVAKKLSEDFWLPEATIFTKKIMGPAKIEALAKGKQALLTKEGWAELQQFITRESPSAPRVVLSIDPSPAIANATAGFTDVPPADDLSDLFN